LPVNAPDAIQPTTRVRGKHLEIWMWDFYLSRITTVTGHAEA
jgi:hypothetical protein